MEMAGLAAFGLTGTFLALVLKKENPQFALLTALATGVLLFLQICSPLGELLDCCGKWRNRQALRKDILVLC